MARIDKELARKWKKMYVDGWGREPGSKWSVVDFLHNSVGSRLKKFSSTNPPTATVANATEDDDGVCNGECTGRCCVPFSDADGRIVLSSS